jgi:hypothetical protein
MPAALTTIAVGALKSEQTAIDPIRVIFASYLIANADSPSSGSSRGAIL